MYLTYRVVTVLISNLRELIVKKQLLQILPLSLRKLQLPGSLTTRKVSLKQITKEELPRLQAKQQSKSSAPKARLMPNSCGGLFKKQPKLQTPKPLAGQPIISGVPQAKVKEIIPKLSAVSTNKQRATKNTLAKTSKNQTLNQSALLQKTQRDDNSIADQKITAHIMKDSPELEAQINLITNYILLAEKYGFIVSDLQINKLRESALALYRYEDNVVIREFTSNLDNFCEKIGNIVNLSKKDVFILLLNVVMSPDAKSGFSIASDYPSWYQFRTAAEQCKHSLQAILITFFKSLF